MTLSNFVAYVTQKWKNKPDTSTPLSAERLTHQEDGIKANSDAIQELAAAVVSQIVNNPDKRLQAWQRCMPWTRRWRVWTGKLVIRPSCQRGLRMPWGPSLSCIVI